jgi:hypothetical protein
VAEDLLAASRWHAFLVEEREDVMRVLKVALIAASALSWGCGGGGNVELNKEEWRIRGTYRVTDYLCGTESVTLDPPMQARITPPNAYEWVYSADGLRMDIRIIGQSCTWGGSYEITYTSATEFAGRGFGVYECNPSSAACHDFMMISNGGDVCEVSNTEGSRGERNLHSAVPAVGGTLDVTFLSDSWCASKGKAGIATFRFTRVQ